MMVINTAFKLLGPLSHNRWARISHRRLDSEFFVSCTQQTDLQGEGCWSITPKNTSERCSKDVFYMAWIESRCKITLLGIDLMVSHGIAYPLPTAVNEKIVWVNEKIYELAQGMKT